ncbi:MAG: M48 family metallopeptidase [Hyphomonadaceae bacterium]
MRLIGFAAFAAAIALAGPAFATALPFDPDEATRQWLATMGPEATERSNRYFEGGYIIQFVGPLVSILISFALLAIGWAKGVRSWLEKTVKLYFLVVLGMALFYNLVSTVLTFPLSYWIGFVREHEFGLSTQNFSQWFVEYLQANAIGLVIGSIAIVLLYLIIRALKRTWWLWGTVAAIAFGAVIQIAYPVYLAPIFNTFTPMEQGSLRTDILHMAQANGVPANDVMVFDVSRQSNRVTANVSGFMETTRISLSDTLIQRASTGGVREVMGHEIGHYVLNHTVSILIMGAVLYAIVFALANILFNLMSKGERWGIRDVSDPAGMPLLFAVITFLFTLATPVQNNMIRYHEHQADIFGLNASREPDGFAETALLLSEYRKMEPTPFELWFFYDHPSGYQRIHMAMQWKAHEMAAGRYPMGPGGPPPGWRPDFVVLRENGGASAAPAPTPAQPEPTTEPSPDAPSN